MKLRKRNSVFCIIFIVVCMTCGCAASPSVSYESDDVESEKYIEQADVELPESSEESESLPAAEPLESEDNVFSGCQDGKGNQEMAFCAPYWCDSYEKVKTVTVVEEAARARIVQTGFSTSADGDAEPVRLQITWDRDGRQGYQVIALDRINSPLTADMCNCRAWDGDDDGYEDILYYTGYIAGSGGVWYCYYLLRWSEAEQEYKSMELPGCDYIRCEEHELHSLVHDGSGCEYYAIYGLWDGEYQLEKGLNALYRYKTVDETAEGWVLTVEYQESGEVVETADFFPAPDWEEAKVILKEKYPEFIYWYMD